MTSFFSLSLTRVCLQSILRIGETDPQTKSHNGSHTNEHIGTLTGTGKRQPRKAHTDTQMKEGATQSKMQIHPHKLIYPK